MGNPPACFECGQVIGAVTAAVDPKNIGGHVFTAGCGHRFDRELAVDLYEMGHRWDLPAVTGASLIAAERLRQVTDEGYTPGHDDEHGEGLQWAGWAYLDRALHPTEDTDPPSAWPWDPAAWNRDADSMRRLEIAGALIAAELDRRLRQGRAKA